MKKLLTIGAAVLLLIAGLGIYAYPKKALKTTAAANLKDFKIVYKDNDWVINTYPLYKLTITGDGKVVLEVAELVDYDLAERNKGGWKLSQKKATLSQEKIELLLSAIQKSGILSLKEGEYFDNGSYGDVYFHQLSVSINGKKESFDYGITDFITTQFPPKAQYKALVNLEKKILQITNADQLIEKAEERLHEGHQ